jgi:DNA-binding transcriptional ArsR family regulator
MALSYSVEVIWHPVFELVQSLQAFTNTRLHKVIDHDATWRAEVRERLPEGLENLLLPPSTHRPVGLIPVMGLTLAWAWLDRTEKSRRSSATVDEFLSWTLRLDVGDMYTIVSEFLREDESIPRNLDELRLQVARALTAWHSCYFSFVDLAILEGLAKEAEARRASQRLVAPEELVEEVSGHVYVRPQEAFSRAVLIPHFHASPWNLFYLLRDALIHLYPVDVLPPAPGQPPVKLIRLTKALSDENRLRILRYLAAGSRSFTEIARHIGLSKATIHHHLVLLRAAGLVRVETSVTSTHGDQYSLRRSTLSELAGELDAFILTTREP